MAARRVIQRNAAGLGIGPMGVGGMQGGVGTAQDAAAGIYAPPQLPFMLGIDLSKASTWSWIWFLVAVGYLGFIYTAHGGRRGGIL